MLTKLSFRAKAIVGVALIEAVTLLLSIFGSLSQLRDGQSELLIQSANSAASLYATAISDALIALDLAKIETVTRGIIERGDAVFVEVTDDRGMPISAFHRVARDTNSPVAQQDPLSSDRPYYETELDLKVGSAHIGLVRLGVSNIAAREKYAEALRSALIYSTAGMVLAAAFSWILGSWLAQGLQNLASVAQDIEAGDLRGRAGSYAHTELNILASAFNQMADALRERDAQQRQYAQRLEQAQQDLERKVVERTSELLREIAEHQAARQSLVESRNELAHVAHKAGMAEVANGVLHNIGNVLNSVSVSAHCLAERISHMPAKDFAPAVEQLINSESEFGRYQPAGPKGEALMRFFALLAEHWAREHADMKAEVERLLQRIWQVEDLVGRHSAHAGSSNLLEQVCIADLVTEVVTAHAAKCAGHGVEVRSTHHGDTMFRSDKSKLLQILHNLLTNAIDALSNAGTERIVEIHSDVSASGLVMTVRDSGPGIAPDVLRHLFTYGFTTKPEGHGYGLHSSLNAARELNGAIRIQCGDGYGALFEITLPNQRIDGGKNG